MDAPALQKIVFELLPAWSHESDATSDWKFLPGGYANENFAFAYANLTYVLRLPAAHNSGVDRCAEKKWYAALPAGVGVNPIAFDADSGRMITPWVGGNLLVDYWRNSSYSRQYQSAQYQSANTVLANYLRTLHGSLPEIDRSYSPQYAPPSSPSSPSSLSSSSSFLSSSPSLSRRTCHNDLNPWNIIVTYAGRWITLDWEWVGNNDPVFDLVSLHQGLGLELGIEDLCTRYFQNSGIDSGVNWQRRLAGCLHAYWYREYAWAEEQLTLGNQRQEIADQRDVALRKLKSMPVSGAQSIQ